MEKRSRRDLTHDARTDPKGRIPPHLFNFCSNHFSAGSDKDLVGYAATEAERSAMDSHEAGGAARRAKKLQLRAGIDAERGHSCAQPSAARDALHLQAFPRPGVGKRKACLINVLHAAVLAFLSFAKPSHQHRESPPFHSYQLGVVVRYLGISLTKLFMVSIAF